jgi:hypothetical protein
MSLVLIVVYSVGNNIKSGIEIISETKMEFEFHQEILSAYNNLAKQK